MPNSPVLSIQPNRAEEELNQELFRKHLKGIGGNVQDAKPGEDSTDLAKVILMVRLLLLLLRLPYNKGIAATSTYILAW